MPGQRLTGQVFAVRHRGYLDRMHNVIGESSASAGGEPLAKTVPMVVQLHTCSPKAFGAAVVSDIVDRPFRW